MNAFSINEPLLFDRTSTDEPYTKDSKRAFNFGPIQALAFVGCGAATIFSTYTSAMEYHNNLGSIAGAAIRTVGVQSCMVVFSALAVMQVLHCRRADWLVRLGCLCGASISVLLALFMFLDSASTSFSYQDYKLGLRTGSERVLEASIHQHDDDVAALRDRYNGLLSDVSDRRAELTEEHARLSDIVGPAVKTGSNLKKGYSDALATVQGELKANGLRRQTLNSELSIELAELQAKRSADAVSLRSANSSGAGSLARFGVGLSPSHVLMARTGFFEATLLALGGLFGIGLFYSKRARNYKTTAIHLGSFAVIFTIAVSLFVLEVSKEAAPANTVVPVVPVEADDDDDRMWFDKDGLPAHDEGWDPDTEFDKMGPGGLDMDQASLPIPKELYVAVMAHVPKADRHWVAAVPKVESSYNPACVGDGGCSVTGFQIHKRYHPEIYASLDGDWTSWDKGVQAYLAVIEKQSQWRGSDSVERKIRYYVDGNSWNKAKAKRYYDRVMTQAQKLKPLFS